MRQGNDGEMVVVLDIHRITVKSTRAGALDEKQK